jgi:hypothetical protein
MRHDIDAQHFAALRILNALERDVWVNKARQVPLTVYSVARFFLAEPADATPAEKVDAARADLAGVLQVHAEAGETLRACARHLALPRSDLWHRWTTRHGEVATAGQEALRFLADASHTVKHVLQAEALQGGKPPNDLLLRAREEIRSARRGLKQLRDLATLEFFSCTWYTLKNISQ